MARLEIDAREVYERALAIRRPEPSGNGFVDRAVRVRIEAAHALVTMGDRDALLDIVPLLADPEAEVRAGVADAIGRMRSPAAAAVLHLQLLLLSGGRGGGALASTDVLIVEVPSGAPRFDCTSEWNVLDPVRSSAGYGTFFTMTQKAAKPPVAVEQVERDPILRALDDAPVNEIDDTDEERAELDARREQPVVVPGSVVSKELGKRRHRDEG